MPPRRLKAAKAQTTVNKLRDASQEVIVEIEATALTPRRPANVEYSPIESACATPTADVEDPIRDEMLIPPNAEDWSTEEAAALNKILTSRRTLAIHWDLVASALFEITGIRRSAQECGEQYINSLAEEYANSANREGQKKNRGAKQVIITPIDEFRARDPTRKFKMTKLLNERTFKDRPASFISPQADGPKARRYSFINDTLTTDFGKCGGEENRKSALSFLKEVLPERGDRPSLKLDDDRFLQKLRGAGSKSGGKNLAKAPSTKRRLHHNATLNNLVSGLAAQTDLENEQCVTTSGLAEELVALSHKEDEYKLLLDEFENVVDNTIIH